MTPSPTPTPDASPPIGPSAGPPASAPGWRSLSTRLSLSTALLFLVGMGSLGWYASHTLQQDTEALLGQQQFSTASLLAAQLNQSLAERIQALTHHAAAQGVDSARAGPAAAAALQSGLDANPALPALFNGGVWVSGVDGNVVASTLPALLGSNYADRDYVIAVLKGEKSAIGKPVVGKVVQDPVLAMAVPVRDGQGRVVAVLAGVTELGKPGFLDVVAGGRYGQTGGFVLVDWQHGLVVSATDKRLVMSNLPAPGASPLIDRFIAGYEGPGTLANPRGIEKLIAARRLALAPWYVAVSLPTAEAFAPLRAMQRRIAIGTLGLGLLAAWLVAWLTRRQLAPLRAAAQALAAPQGDNLARQPLPLPPGRGDEVAALIQGFNEVLAELARREALLRANEQGLATTLDSIGDAVIATDRAGCVTRMNPAAARLTGWPLADALGRPLDEVFRIISAETRLPSANPVQRVMASGDVVGLANHTALLARDGQEHQIADTAAPIRDTAGAIQGVVLVFSDVSEKYRAEAELQATKNHLQATLDAIPDLLFEVGLDGRVHSHHTHRADLLAAPPEVFLGKTFAEVLPPAAAEVCMAALREAAVQGLSIGGTYALPLPTGERWFELSVAAMPATPGGEQRFIVLSRDITLRRQVEAASRENEMRLRLVIRGGDIGFWDWDLRSSALVVNERWCDMLGMDPQGLTPGIDVWNSRVHPDDAPKLVRLFEQVMLNPNGDSGEVEVRARHQAGHWVWILDRFSVVSRDADGAPLRAVGTHVDITERKLAELALQASLRDKEALLKEVHHRVKNNLQVVSSLLRLEAGRSGHAPTQAVLADMQGRIRAMALLHESIYRSGTLASIDLGSYIRQVATQALRSQQTSGAAAQPQLRLELGSVQAGLDQATPCGLLLTELVSNALKHGFPAGSGGAGGEVVIELQPAPGGAADLWRLRVSDNGVGLPADFAARQQDSLGLQLVASLALQLGGSLVVEAAAGADGPADAPVGARFAVTFAVLPPEPLALPA